MPFDIGFMQTDLDVEDNGFWHDFGDARVRIARIGNRKYKKAMADKLPDHIASKFTEADREKILGEILGTTILVSWEGLQENGEDLPYTEANAIRLMSDPSYRDFREAVIKLAGHSAFYRKEYTEELIKNL